MWRNISWFKACVGVCSYANAKNKTRVTRLESLRWGPYCVAQAGLQLPICALRGSQKFSLCECSLSAGIWGQGDVCTCVHVFIGV